MERRQRAICFLSFFSPLTHTRCVYHSAKHGTMSVSGDESEDVDFSMVHDGDYEHDDDRERAGQIEIQPHEGFVGES